MQQPPLRASDDDREQVIALLRQASVDGRLTVEELADRAELAQAARTYDELRAIAADLLPGGRLPTAADAAGGPLSGAVERHRAVLSSLDRRGRWTLAPRSRFVATLGSIQLDLRQAIMPGPEVEIVLKAVLGSAELLVPEGTDVRVSGGNVLGSCELHLGAEAPPPGAPIVRVIVAGALGSVEVRSEPRLADRIKAEAKRFAQRLMSPPPQPPRPRAPRPPAPPS
ncbi:DUF1707 domain-containing protein [Conexibacter sp. CPCC 206217]|uniref:DUF1707 SHOCT-like domain-containing protein n=1 Tax=Conexibacter sp. CPCC 206217 TaxID=3064574 RepID=UPI00271A5D21|nr:DUF1707 domain-containing protein [Conexibacter sp. CPCC 206217]MDO8212945.1 DUF1707 domain-containing protein [Conexibacter sp. CPCC 206217]